jgi:hypothetical protein
MFFLTVKGLILYLGSKDRGPLLRNSLRLAKSYDERLRGCKVRNMNPEKAEGLSPALAEPQGIGAVLRQQWTPPSNLRGKPNPLWLATYRECSSIAIQMQSVSA